MLQSETASLCGTEWSEPAAQSPMLQPLLEPRIPESPMSPVTVTGKPITCPICCVYGVFVGFSRKSDFKKHLNQFHNTNFLWICRHERCTMVFDFDKAYTSHIKSEHSEPHISGDEAKVQLCPQVNFACGFANCKDKLFEADNDQDAPTVAQAYFEHVASHFDKKAVESVWEYSTQMQNLLRQRSVKDKWKNSMWPKVARNALRWQPRSSGDLKKLLECRHLGNISDIVHKVFTLGSTTFQSAGQPAPTSIPWDSLRPVSSRCSMAASKHINHFSIGHSTKPPPRAVFPPKLNTSIAKATMPPQVHSSPVSEDFSGWDIVGGPHPGKQFHIPNEENTGNWAADPDPFEEQDHVSIATQAPTFDYPMAGMHLASDPLGLYSAMHTLGPSPSQEEVLADLDKSPRPKTPKRRMSLGPKSLENLRLKKGRNSSPSHDLGDMPPMPVAQQQHQVQLDFPLPFRGNMNMPTPNFSF
jgi:hypothetical protein